MKISSAEKEEHSGYGSGGGDDVAISTVKDNSMHEMGKEDSDLGKGKMKLLKEMHVETDGKISKKIKKSPPASKPKNVAFGPARKNPASSKEPKSPSNSPAEIKTRAIIRAEEFRSSLGTKFPTFIKPMLKSHVSGGYWLGLPAQFCKSHLPENDLEITLENENRERFQMRYLFHKVGLSGGWRNFAITQNLVEGDVTIFQLVDFNKFKVYIIRNNDLNEDNGALALVNVDAREQQNDKEKEDAENCQKALTQNIAKRKRSKSLQPTVVQKYDRRVPGKSAPKTLQLAKKIKNNDKGTGLEIIASPSSPSQKQFKDIKSFKDFTIIVDELCIDSELPDHIRAKYYALCNVEKSYLHADLMQGLNSKLIAGVICEIVGISDSLKQCDFTTCRNEFANWEKALKSFDFLGMNVGFLRGRIQKLVQTLFNSDGAIKFRKYMEAKLGRIRAEDEMRGVGSKIVELEKASKKYYADIKALKLQAESFEHKFRAAANVSW